MTTDSPSSRSTSGPSIHVVRARKLLFGGLLGGVAAAIICLIIFTILDGTRGLGSAALAAGMVLFFYTVGQLVMVAFADAGARTLMLVSMTSYTGRVIILGLILLVFSKSDWAWLDNAALFITTIAVVAGWIAVEMVVFSRLRIGVYDQEYSGPDSSVTEDSSDTEDSDDPNPPTRDSQDRSTGTGGPA